MLYTKQVAIESLLRWIVESMALPIKGRRNENNI